MNAIRRTVLRTRRHCIDRGGGAVRVYEPGEEARAIDWRVSARTGSVHMRERGHVTLVWGALLDTSLSMTSGRFRGLGEAAREAVEFWRECGAAADRWIEIDAGEYRGLLHGLDRALRVLPGDSALLVAGDFFDLPAVPGALLQACGRRMDCTALVARDPWRDHLALAGFVTVADLETQDLRRFFIGSRERERFRRETHARERAILARLRQSGWRAATFSEEDGARAVLCAFGAS